MPQDKIEALQTLFKDYSSGVKVTQAMTNRIKRCAKVLGLDIDVVYEAMHYPKEYAAKNGIKF